MSSQEAGGRRQKAGGRRQEEERIYSKVLTFFHALGYFHARCTSEEGRKQSR
ncbi:MAG: hypothetical protein F6K41_06610 [Symploca sp. SIO3E6]|nr:hypothetical protein [Caldora sp. SIO3E6]